MTRRDMIAVLHFLEETPDSHARRCIEALVLDALATDTREATKAPTVREGNVIRAQFGRAQ